MKQRTKVLGPLLIAVLMVVMLLAGMVLGSPLAQAGAGDPLPGTVVGIWTNTIYPAEYRTGASGTDYSTSPRWVSNLDISKTRNWHSADIFVTADVSGTATVTVTAQYSADATNWTDAEYKSEGWVLPLSATLTNASGVTSTTTSTLTFAAATASRSSEWVKYETSLSADGTEFFSMPMAGEHLRFKVAHTASPTEGVTVTIKMSTRND